LVFFLLTKQITSYPYKIDIENQLEVSAAEKGKRKACCQSQAVAKRIQKELI
jgi:hypothetical protein